MLGPLQRRLPPKAEVSRLDAEFNRLWPDSEDLQPALALQDSEMNRKLRFRNLSANDGPAAVVHGASRQTKRAVYFQVADRPVRYKRGKNRIVYIGATKAGHERIMSSLAKQIPYLFRIPGVNTIEVHVISCEPRQRVKTWLILERACLLISGRTMASRLGKTRKVAHSKP